MRMGAGGIRAGLYMGFSHEQTVHIVDLGCLRRWGEWRLGNCPVDSFSHERAEPIWQDDTPVGAGVNHA